MERDRRERHRRQQTEPKFRLSHEFKQKLVLALLIIAAIAVIAVVISLAGKIFKKKSMLSPTELSFDGEIFATSNSIYYMQGTDLYCSDLKGTVLWSSKNNSGKMEISGSSSFICAYNEKTAIVTGPNREARFTITPNDYIIKKVVCGRDMIVLLTETIEDDPVQYLRAFDVNGNDLQRTEITDGELLGFGINSRTDNLWVLVLDTNGIEPVSRLTISNPAQNKMTGIIEISDQLVYEVHFGKEDTYLMGTNNMIRYNSVNEKKSDTLIYGLKCVDITENGSQSVFAFIQNDIREGSDIYNVHVITSNAGQNPSDALIQIPQGVKNIALSSDRLICFAENCIHMYKFNGEYDTSIELDLNVTNVRKLADDLLLVSTDKGVYLYNI